MVPHRCETRAETHIRSRELSRRILASGNSADSPWASASSASPRLTAQIPHFVPATSNLPSGESTVA